MKKLLFVISCLGFFCFGLDDVKAAPPLADGTYKIQSALNNNKVLDVKSANAVSGNNVQLYTFNNTSAQHWTVKHLGNNYYKITSALDNSLVLDVANAGKKNGTNIQIHKSNGTNAQQWLVKYAGNGYYYIMSKCNGLYVDVNGGKTADKTNIQMYKGNGSNAQKFKFIEVLEGKKTIENGTYTITSALNDSKAVSVKNSDISNGMDVQIYDYTHTWGQYFNVKYLDNGYYEISNYWDNNMVLDVRGGIAINGTKIQIHNKNNTDAQKWIIKDAGNGYYNIVSKKDNIYIDVNGGYTTNGTSLQTYHSNGTTAQKFKFNKINEPQKITDGYYTLNSAVDPNRVLAVNSATAYNSANVTLKTDDGSNTSKWYVKHVGGLYYMLQNAANTNRLLDVQGAKTANGTNIQIYNSNNNNAQRWIIQDNLDGTYTLVSKLGKVADVDVKKGIKDGTNIQLYHANGTDAQKWTFKPTTYNQYSRSYEDGYYTINSVLDSSKVLDINNAMKTNGTNVQLYMANSTNAQVWYLKYLNNGYYSITSAMNPKISLDVANGGTTSGTNLQIFKNNNSEAQQWLLHVDTNGHTTIIARNNGLAIDVKNSSTANGTNIQLVTPNGNDNQKFVLTPYTKTKVYKGIDISSYNTINWDSLAKDGKVDFVIIRAGYGGNWTNQDDTKFKANVAACEKYNIPYGTYLYSYAADIDTPDKTGANEEAKHMLRLLNEIKVSNYVPTLGTEVFLDVEDKSVANVSKDKLTSVVNHFCTTIENNGYRCGVYASSTWLNDHLNSPELVKKFDIWLAQWPYGNTTPVSYTKAMNTKPSYNTTSYKYWQFTSSGSSEPLAGISGRLDLDLGYDIFD